MASYSVHMAFAKMLNEELHMEEDSLMMGSVAADICYYDGEPKSIAHFETGFKKADSKKFLEKYQGELNNPFVMGYLSHLYLDEHFYDDFLKQYYDLKEGHSYTDQNAIFIDKNTKKIIPFNEIYSPEGIYGDYQKIDPNVYFKYNLKKEYNTHNIVNIIEEIDNKKIGFINYEINRFPAKLIKEPTKCFEYEDLQAFLKEYAKKFIRQRKLYRSWKIS